jgi:hypothetical protein
MASKLCSAAKLNAPTSAKPRTLSGGGVGEGGAGRTCACAAGANSRQNTIAAAG